jgi:NADP-dependent 3-hydroxy acid dehydrogenase YdfG
MTNLKGKIAWVTGAGTGIGLAGAAALAEAGALVVVSGRRREILEKEAQNIISKGGRIEVEALDVTNPIDPQNVADAIKSRHGKLDILVNNAGLNTQARFWRDQTLEGWNQIIRTNLDGLFYCTKAVLPMMRAQKDGLVINIASWAGVYPSTVVGPAYSGSKHAVVSITENLNMEECANGIRGCVICPAEVNTPIMDLRPEPPSAEKRARMLQAEDVGRTICWVADQPPHVCINQIIISPTWNRAYLEKSL